jgi:hypothetical protein
MKSNQSVTLGGTLTNPFSFSCDLLFVPWQLIATNPDTLLKIAKKNSSKNYYSKLWSPSQSLENSCNEVFIKLISRRLVWRLGLPPS